MKLYDGGTMILLVILGLALGYVIIDHVYDLPDDNIIEEQIENALETQTGAELDLTPKTPEKR